MVKVLSIIGIFICTSSIGQTFQNIRTRVEEDKIIIIYDLISLEQGSRVSVSLYSSHNNFESPLVDVTGDVGLVLPGPNRRITWKEGVGLENADKITFQFKGEIIQKLKILNPAMEGKVKKGKLSTIRWQGGQSDEQVTITLQSPDKEINEIAKTSNTRSFAWSVPNKIKAGKGYVLRITGSDNFTEQRFSIKRKVPLGLYAIPVVGAVIFIISNGGSDGVGNLPDAPSPN